MTILKKPTNLNRRRRPLGKIYRSFEEDIWGHFLYKIINFNIRYKFLLNSKHTYYKNMRKVWNLIRQKHFSRLIKKSRWESQKRNILRIDLVNPRRFKKKATQRTIASIEAKKFRLLYNNMPINQIKKLIKSHKSTYINKYHGFLMALESRLDTAIYRLHFVTTIGQARQFINHGNVTVNGRIVNKPSYQLKRNDVISCVFTSRRSILKSILRRLLPFRNREILYYYPAYFEVNYRILSAKLVCPPHMFSDRWIPFFSKKGRDFVKKGFVYFSYKTK